MKRIAIVFLFQLFFTELGWAQNAKIDSLLTQLNSAQEDSNKVLLLLKLRDIYFFYSISASTNYNNMALSLSQKLNYKPGIITSYLYLSGIYSRKGNFKGAFNCYNKIAPLVECKDSNGLAYLYNYMAAYYADHADLTDYLKAMNYSNKALLRADETGDSVMIVQSLETRAKIYRALGDYQMAINYFLQTIKMCQRRHDIFQLAGNYYNIAVVYNQAQDYNKAIDNYDSSYEIAKKINSNLLLAGDLAVRGDIYLNQNQYNKALDCFKQSVIANFDLKDSITVNDNLREIAMVYCKLDSFKQAIQATLLALQIAKNMNDKNQVGNDYACLGKIYLTQKKYTVAIDYLDKSLIIANAFRDKYSQITIYDNLATCYSALGNYKYVSINLASENTLKDSIAKGENAKRDMGMIIFEKNEKQIAMLTQNKEIQKLQIKRQALLEKSLLIGIILMGILFFFVYRSYHIRQLLKLQTLRNKIASDLHDDIGSTLSSISIFTLVAREGSREVIPMLDKIGEYSRNMLESMSDIVWSINPDNDNFEKIILRMRSFAFELLRTKNIDFEFDADESLDSLKVSMELRKNLYLIFKEATNNMVKYSEANSAMFSITSSKNVLTMIIRDNGKGFDPTKNNQGNGLKNMKKRAEEIGAIFLIESEPGAGTTIQLSTKAA